MLLSPHRQSRILAANFSSFAETVLKRFSKLRIPDDALLWYRFVFFHKGELKGTTAGWPSILGIRKPLMRQLHDHDRFKAVFLKTGGL